MEFSKFEIGILLAGIAEQLFDLDCELQCRRDNNMPRKMLTLKRRRVKALFKRLGGTTLWWRQDN